MRNSKEFAAASRRKGNAGGSRDGAQRIHRSRNPMVLEIPKSHHQRPGGAGIRCATARCDKGPAPARSNRGRRKIVTYANTSKLRRMAKAFKVEMLRRSRTSSRRRFISKCIPRPCRRSDVHCSETTTLRFGIPSFFQTRRSPCTVMNIHA